MPMWLSCGNKRPTLRSGRFRIHTKSGILKGCLEAVKVCDLLSSKRHAQLTVLLHTHFPSWVIHSRVHSRGLQGGPSSVTMADPAIESLAPYWETVISNCNSGREQKKLFTPFKLEGEILGYIHPSFWEHLKNFTQVFIVDPGDLRTGTGNGWITLQPTCNSTGERSRQIDLLLRLLEREKIIIDWRNELCPVVTRFDGHRFFSIERAALPFFGVKCYCLHLNGFVRKNGKDFLWISKRSKKKKSFSGVMDNMVAAVQPAGGNCKENLITKAYEKANIPAHITKNAISCGHVSYEQCNGMKMKRDVIYCYDLELPPDFLPFNNDGDIENFQLVSLADVAKMVCTPGQYKLNSSLVVVDFLFRHGHINPMQTGYIHLHESLRSGDNH